MSQPPSKYDTLAAARIANCLKIAVSAGRERMLALDQADVPFLASRLRGALEALLASRHLGSADRAQVAGRCARLGRTFSDTSPFEALAPDIGAPTPVSGDHQQDRDSAACSTFLTCVHAHEGAAPAHQAPDGLDYRIGAAADYLTGARLLHPADTAYTHEVLHRSGITVHDPGFGALYEGLNAELEDVLRQIRPVNYTWRGRLVGRYVRCLTERSGADLHN